MLSPAHATVMIIDDEPENLNVLGEMLRQEDWDVLAFPCGEMAIHAAAAADELPDLVLLDIRMPGLDGYEVCRHFKADERLSAIPIIFVSASSITADKVHAFAVGGVDYITKPFRQAEVLTRVRTHIALSRAHAQLLTQHAELQVHKLELVMQNEELRRTQVDLEAARARYFDLYNLAPVGYITVSEPGLILDINLFAANLLGVTCSKLLNRPLSHFVFKDDQELYYRQRKQLLASADAQNYELRLLKPDGTLLWTHLVATVAPNAEGVPRSYVVLTDITQRKQADEALAAETLRRRVLFEQSPDGILVIDPQTTRFLEFNTAAHQQLGYSREEFARLSIHDVEVKEGVRETKTRIAAVIQSGGAARFETQQRTQQGEVRDVHVTAQNVQGQGQTMYQCFWRDITEFKREEEARREGEARLHAITDTARDAVVMMNPQGLITYWNPAAEQLFGYPKPEALGQNLHQLLAPARYHAAHRAGFASFIRSGQGGAVNRTLGLEACHRDGHEIPVEMSLSAFLQQDGWHAAAILRDITARQRAEAELQETNRRLAEATAHAHDLASRAESATAAKGEFLANMSHEIRTPLNGVIGMTGLLLDTPLDPEQRRYAEAVRSSGEALLGLINDILDFSKIEAGKLDLETLDFELLSLLDDLATTLALRAHDKGLELFCGVDPAVPTRLRGDPGRLRQILNNLAGNAVKFTSAGEVAIRASLIEEAGSDVLLRFAVRDTGIGIPADKLGLIFGKFTQVDASITRQYGGSGLGLAISKQLAELMGGQIGVESVEGQGSEFWFTVRLSRQAGEAPAADRPAADLRGVRTLLVDDSATARELLTPRLAAWGLRPVAVPDGPSALQALTQALAQHDPFRLALIDQQMPGMDGETLGRAIRADPRLADTRRVLLTSLGLHGDTRRFQELGFAASATKPIRHEDLRSMLSLALQERHQPSPAPMVTRHTAPKTVNRFAGRQARILVAEDNIVNQLVVLGMLKKMGLSADAVANGAEALKALESVPYALVLMDIQMPEMDGIEATRRLRQPESAVLNPRIPVIALTANAMQGDREHYLAAGMNDHIAKPVSPQALAEALERWLPPKAAGRQPPPPPIPPPSIPRRKRPCRGSLRRAWLPVG